MAPPLASYAALLEPAERTLLADAGHTLAPSGPLSVARARPVRLRAANSLGDRGAAANPPGHVEGTGRRLGLDPAAQTVDGIVGQPDRIVVGPRVGHHGEHRTEDLLLRDAHVVGADEDGRLEEEPLVEALRPLSSGEELRPLFLARLDVALDALALLLPDQWPQYGRGVPRVADLDGGRHGCHPFFVGVEQVLG